MGDREGDREAETQREKEIHTQRDRQWKGGGRDWERERKKTDKTREGVAKAEKDKMGRETDRGMIGDGWGEVHPGRAPRLLPQVAQDKSSPP